MNRVALRFLCCLAPLGALACGDDVGGTEDGGSATDAAVLPDADGAAPQGVTRWVAVDGDDDTGDGSEAAPWRTWERAIPALGPGDTLMVGEGSWPSLVVRCDEEAACNGTRCPEGLPGAPITVRAAQERRARIEAGGRTGISLRGCRHWTFDGFWVRQGDQDGVTDVEAVVLLVEASHVTLRRMLVTEPNRWANNHGMGVYRCDHVLFEENEIYDFHRNAFSLGGVAFPTFRRNYINSRDVPNLPDPAFNCCDPDRGDIGINLDEVYRGIVENNVIERVGSGITVYGGDSSTPVFDGVGSGIRVLGNVVLSSRYGVYARSGCEETDPCSPQRQVRDLEVRELVAVDNSYGVRLDAATNAVLRELTAIRSGTDFRIERSTANAAVSPSFILMNALDVGDGDGIGYHVEDQADWLVTHANSVGNADDFAVDADQVIEHGSVDPQLGGCMVRIPEGSPLRGAGVGGRDIGANLIHRIRDGRPTDEPLWDPETGAFPCGAIVEGVNDPATHPGAVCADVHERLNVGTGGCPIP